MKTITILVGTDQYGELVQLSSAALSTTLGRRLKTFTPAQLNTAPQITQHTDWPIIEPYYYVEADGNTVSRTFRPRIEFREMPEAVQEVALRLQIPCPNPNCQQLYSPVMARQGPPKRGGPAHTHKHFYFRAACPNGSCEKGKWASCENERFKNYALQNGRVTIRGHRGVVANMQLVKITVDDQHGGMITGVNL